MDNMCLHALKKMLGHFNPNLGQIWTNPNVGLKMYSRKWKLGYIFYSTFGFVHIWPKFGL